MINTTIEHESSEDNDTLQGRADLLYDTLYKAVKEGLDLDQLEDEAQGISIEIVDEIGRSFRDPPILSDTFNLPTAPTSIPRHPYSIQNLRVRYGKSLGRQDLLEELDKVTAPIRKGETITKEAHVKRFNARIRKLIAARNGDSSAKFDANRMSGFHAINYCLDTLIHLPETSPLRAPIEELIVAVGTKSKASKGHKAATGANPLLDLRSQVGQEEWESTTKELSILPILNPERMPDGYKGLAGFSNERTASIAHDAIQKAAIASEGTRSGIDTLLDELVAFMDPGYQEILAKSIVKVFKHGDFDFLSSTTEHHWPADFKGPLSQIYLAVGYLDDVDDMAVAMGVISKLVAKKGDMNALMESIQILRLGTNGPPELSPLPEILGHLIGERAKCLSREDMNQMEELALDSYVKKLIDTLPHRAIRNAVAGYLRFIATYDDPSNSLTNPKIVAFMTLTNILNIGEVPEILAEIATNGSEEDSSFAKQILRSDGFDLIELHRQSRRVNLIVKGQESHSWHSNSDSTNEDGAYDPFTDWS